MECKLLAVIIYCTLLGLIQRVLCHSIVDSNVNPFDGGPLNSCRIPSFQSDSICQDVVNYEVPSAIARLVRIIERHIVLSTNDLMGISQECEDSYTKILCLQRFPACQNGTVLLGQQNHNLSIELNERCDESVTVRTRSQERRLPLDDTCRPIYEIIGSDFTFSRCQVNNDNLATPWMTQYLKMVDQTLSHEEDFLFVDSYTKCGGKLAFHLCNFIGRCTGDGRVEYVNTYENCSSAINCYSHMIQEVISDDIRCEEWPSNTERLISRTTTPKVSSDKDKPVTDIKDILGIDPGDTGILDSIVSSAMDRIVSLSSLVLGTTLFYAFT